MFSHPGLRHLQQVVKMAPLPSQRWWDSKSRELTLFDCLMLAVVPETGRSLDLQTSFWLTSSILENKRSENPKMPKKIHLGLLSAIHHRFGANLGPNNMPAAASDDFNSYFNHLSAFKSGAFARGFSQDCAGTPKRPLKRNFHPFWPNTLADSYRFSFNLFRAMPWGTTIQSFFDYMGVSQHPMPSIPFLFH